jgi:hypothetical protein
MAPWTGLLIQATLERLTPSNVHSVAQKLINLLETRTQVQKLAIHVATRVEKCYEPTFYQPHDDSKRRSADTLVASLLRCFANYRKVIKGVPTAEGLSGIPLLKSDLLRACQIERQISIAPIATALYNSQALNYDEIKDIILSLLDTNYANDIAKVAGAILLLEHAARVLDQEDEQLMNSIMIKVKAQLDQVPDKACERKRSGNRLIPSCYDRYWVSDENPVLYTQSLNCSLFPNSNWSRGAMNIGR